MQKINDNNALLVVTLHITQYLHQCLDAQISLTAIKENKQCAIWHAQSLQHISVCTNLKNNGVPFLYYVHLAVHVYLDSMQLQTVYTHRLKQIMPMIALLTGCQHPQNGDEWVSTFKSPPSKHSAPLNRPDVLWLKVSIENILAIKKQSNVCQLGGFIPGLSTAAAILCFLSALSYAPDHAKTAHQVPANA